MMKKFEEVTSASIKKVKKHIFLAVFNYSDCHELI